mmetsp:Transcript_10029/g.22097  ORF Transcript_10029/g.22097 Transcript_10029/m.22097 type:complete len:227 (-) Transcript_10029:1149-1829(-)
MDPHGLPAAKHVNQRLRRLRLRLRGSCRLHGRLQRNLQLQLPAPASLQTCVLNGTLRLQLVRHGLNHLQTSETAAALLFGVLTTLLQTLQLFLQRRHRILNNPLLLLAGGKFTAAGRSGCPRVLLNSRDPCFALQRIHVAHLTGTVLQFLGLMQDLPGLISNIMGRSNTSVLHGCSRCSQLVQHGGCRRFAVLPSNALQLQLLSHLSNLQITSHEGTPGAALFALQ